MHPLAARLSERSEAAGISLNDLLRDRLLTYYELLVRWNSKINLTSLTDPDEAIDRLLLEPVAAAAVLPRKSALMDLGSGGGSPAIPLALALDSARLVMVESKGRKAAFLREAARAVGLPAAVEATRFEELAESGHHQGEFDIVSLRAVRMDLEALTAAAGFMTVSGTTALFVSEGSTVALPPGFRVARRDRLVRNAELLCVMGNVPRET